MSEKLKAVLLAVAMVGVFALCGVGVYSGEMSAAAAVATSLAALTNAGVLSQIRSKSED